MNINWNEKPDWADVWITDKSSPSYSGWHRFKDDLICDEFNRSYPEEIIFNPDYEFHYPPKTRPSQVMTWQPIETAPKDGTVIDLWYPTTKPNRLINCRWYKKHKYWGTLAAHKSDHIETRCESPTHWMIAVNPETKPDWNGELVPPYGFPCEAYIFADTEDHQGKSYAKWESGASEGEAISPDHGIAGVFRDSRGKRHIINDYSYFRPIKSDKEKWIEQASKTFHTGKPFTNCLGAVYDALISGELPVPEVRK